METSKDTTENAPFRWKNHLTGINLPKEIVEMIGSPVSKTPDLFHDG
jgi:hypothetical protein